MKLLAFVLVCLPMALAIPDRRMVLEDLLDVHAMKAELQQLLDVIGADATEQMCEQQCPGVFQHYHAPPLLQSACPLVCATFQTLVNKLHLTQDHAPVHTKRYFINDLNLLNLLGLNITQLKADLQILVDDLGSDPKEQQFEAACHRYLDGGVLGHGCALLGHSFQALLHKFQITPDQGTPGAMINSKRRTDLVAAIAHALHLDEIQLKTDLQQILDTVGSQPAQDAVRLYCHSIASGLADKACDLLAAAYPQLLQLLHLHQDPVVVG